MNFMSSIHLYDKTDTFLLFPSPIRKNNKSDPYITLQHYR
jgi:hypothetical protein